MSPNKEGAFIYHPIITKTQLLIQTRKANWK